MANEMKSLVEQMIAGLKQRGINVTDAAVLSFGNQPNGQATAQTVAQATTPSGPEAVKQMIEGLRKKGFNIAFPGQQTQDQPVNGEQPKVQCYCPECFNFDTFEQVLSNIPGTFDKVEITLGGKPFTIKYHRTDANGLENIMISEKKEKVDLSALNIDQLQQGLNIAVQNKDFDTAQLYLNAINETKNKN